MFPIGASKTIGLKPMYAFFLPVLGFLKSKRAPRNPNHRYPRRVWGLCKPTFCSHTQLQLNQHRLSSLALGVQGDLDVLAGGIVQPRRQLVRCSTIKWVGSSSCNLVIKLLNRHLQNQYSCTQKPESIRKETCKTFSIKNLPRNCNFVGKFSSNQFHKETGLWGKEIYRYRSSSRSFEHLEPIWNNPLSEIFAQSPSFNLRRFEHFEIYSSPTVKFPTRTKTVRYRNDKIKNTKQNLNLHVSFCTSVIYAITVSKIEFLKKLGVASERLKTFFGYHMTRL